MPIFPSPELLIAHDVQPADLSRLLEDCHLMGKLSTRDHVVSNVIPLALGMSFVGGIFATKGIEKHMKGKKVADVNGLLEVWDIAFFAPRRLRLSIESANMMGGNGFGGNGYGGNGYGGNGYGGNGYGGNGFVSNRKSLQSANEAGRMQKLAS